jgi:hypothetical protein
MIGLRPRWVTVRVRPSEGGGHVVTATIEPDRKVVVCEELADQPSAETFAALLIEELEKSFQVHRRTWGQS